LDYHWSAPATLPPLQALRRHEPLKLARELVTRRLVLCERIPDSATRKIVEDLAREIDGATASGMTEQQVAASQRH
jgi:hypothetical protein